MNHPVQKFRQQSGGFSLIEVVLALGVLACVILPMIGLMPHGAETLRNAIRQSGEANIRQEILGTLNTADWAENDDLASYDQSIWYFDGQGVRVTAVEDALYTVFLEVSDCKLPGALAANSFLRTVTMKITDLPASARPFDDASRYRRYVATVAKQDQ